MTGLKDVVGKKITEVFPEIKASNPELFEIYDRLALTGQPEKFEIFLKFLNRYFSVSTYSPSKGYLVAVFDDITQSKQAGEQLQKKEERARLLADLTGRLLAARKPRSIIGDLCQKVMAHLDCQVFLNFLPDEQTGRLHLHACGGISAEEARKLEWLDDGESVCGWVAAKKESLIVENLFNRPDSRAERIKPFGLQAYCCHPLIIQNNLIGVLSLGTKTRACFLEEEVELMRTFADEIAIALDRVRLIKKIREARDSLELQVRERTADLQEAMVKLERKNKEMEDFVLFASHDLQDPLRKIETFCHRIDKVSGTYLDETGQDYLNRVIRAADFMHRLLKGFLDLSTLSTKAVSFRKINLNQVVLEAVEVFEEKIQKSGAKVEIGDLPTLAADETQMMQLFQNLIGNALKFRREEAPLIRISSLQVSPELYEIVVKDNGIGIDRDLTRVIFNPFGWLKGGTSREGTGLGLAICHKIVERHGGTIRVESEPGEGAAFIVRLPRNQGRVAEK
jgi:signal transduction histidine kinase